MNDIIGGRYRKLPVEISAFRYGYHAWADPAFYNAAKAGIIQYFPDMENPEFSYALIETKEGKLRCNFGDWVIQGVAGEYYSCKHEIFLATYEPVTPGGSKVVRQIDPAMRGKPQ